MFSFFFLFIRCQYPSSDNDDLEVYEIIHFWTAVVDLLRWSLFAFNSYYVEKKKKEVLMSYREHISDNAGHG